MKYSLLIPLTLTTMLFTIGCEKDKKDENEPIAINKIEQNITKKNTSLGCEHKDNNSQECSQEEMDSAKFILNTLNSDLNTPKETSIDSIKENLNNSIKAIEKEVNKKKELKENLEALVNELNINKKKSLENFVSQISNSEFKDIEENRVDNSSNRISTIKDELKSLIEEEELKAKPKIVKKRLETLIANVTESKNDLVQIEKNLKSLVDEAEKKNSPSATKFASAIIEDVSSKKISIVKEEKDSFVIKVKRGENLSILAKRYYNDASKYRLIYEANKDKINSKYEIYPGSELLIPKI